MGPYDWILIMSLIVQILMGGGWMSDLSRERSHLFTWPKITDANRDEHADTHTYTARNTDTNTDRNASIKRGELDESINQNLQVMSSRRWGAFPIFYCSAAVFINMNKFNHRDENIWNFCFRLFDCSATPPAGKASLAPFCLCQPIITTASWHFQFPLLWKLGNTSDQINP